MPVIRPNYLAAESDRRSSVGVVRFLMRDGFHSRRWPRFSARRRRPDRDRKRRRDSRCLRAAGAIRLPRLRNVPDGNGFASGAGRSVCGCAESPVLRVVDLSFFPTMVSGNTNGPMMALAWRAADLILEDASDNECQDAGSNRLTRRANAIVRRRWSKPSRGVARPACRSRHISAASW